MKFIQALLISIALFISSLSHASTLDEIMKTGVLKVGTTGDFPGWSFINPETNEYEGYDIDVAKKLAEDMGVDIEFVATDWKNLVSGVVASKYHMTSSASITTQRALTAGYSNSYYGTGTVAMTLAGNAALFGSADIRIATKNSWIGMAGPAMIEGGGLGKFDPKEIGPSDIQKNNGVIDYVAEDEKEATIIAKKILSYFQGDIKDWKADDQTQLSNILPKDRRWSYPVRDIIKIISDIEEFTEIKPEYGKGIVTCFIRIEGKPFGLLANDSQHLGGAIDSEGADKASSFIEICSEYGLPLISLVDTPGFMVGPDSEKEGAVKRMSNLFKVGSKVKVPLTAIFLRKGYGLGAQAMVGGSLHEPVYTAAWPTGEFGAMGLEGAVKLGFKKELEKIEDNSQREKLFNSLVEKLYDKGKAIEAAAHLEIDAVINPSETRSVILKSQKALV